MSPRAAPRYRAWASRISRYFSMVMILNNAAFILQWMILFHIKEDIGGYTMREVMLLWGLAASTFGLSRILFARAWLPSSRAKAARIAAPVTVNSRNRSSRFTLKQNTHNLMEARM